MGIRLQLAVHVLLVGTAFAAASSAGAQGCMAGVVAGRTVAAPPGTPVSVASLRVPEKAWKHLYRALEAAHTGKDGDLTQEIAKALDIAPAFAEAYMLRASWEVTAHHDQAAIEDVRTARLYQPQIFWAGVILGSALNGLQRYTEAATVLAALPSREHETWQAKYEMARAAIGKHDAAESLRWSTAALQSAPAECLDTRLLVADAYLLAQRWSDAVTELTAYLESRLPQRHHAEVLAMLERTRRRLAEQEKRTSIASADPPQP